MNKKVVLFYLIFAVLMIGGSFLISLWIFPKIVANERYIGFGYAGMLKPVSGQVLTKQMLLLIFFRNPLHGLNVTELVCPQYIVVL